MDRRDATRRQSRSLSPLLEEERPSQGPGLLHFLRGVRDAFHILLARGRTSAIGYDVKIPRGGFTFEIKTFSPGKCCAALVHTPIERAKSGSLQWKRLSRWSIIERRFWYLVSLLLSLFSFLIEWIDLSYLEQRSRSRSQTKMYIALVMFRKTI